MSGVLTTAALIGEVAPPAAACDRLRARGYCCRGLIVDSLTIFPIAAVEHVLGKAVAVNYRRLPTNTINGYARCGYEAEDRCN